MKDSQTLPFHSKFELKFRKVEVIHNSPEKERMQISWVQGEYEDQIEYLEKFNISTQ